MAHFSSTFFFRKEVPFKESSVITFSHIIFKELYHQLVLDMNANGKSMHNVNFGFDKRTIEALLF